MTTADSTYERRYMRQHVPALCARTLVLVVIGLSGCRFNGAPDIDPSPTASRIPDAPQTADPLEDTAQQTPPSAAGAGSAAAPSRGDAGSNARPDTADTGVDASHAAATVPSATVPSATVPSATDDDAGACGASASIAVCDPIAKTGCVGELGMQCDVDLMASTPTGQCVFNSPPMPDTCVNIPPTESCPAGQTCTNGSCKTICLCDVHCDKGECCNEPIGAGGLKTCSPC